MRLFALEANSSSLPLFQRSMRAAISALTFEDVARDFCGPSTSVGNMKRASQVPIVFGTVALCRTI